MTEVAVLNSQGVPTSRVVLKTGFTVLTADQVKPILECLPLPVFQTMFRPLLKAIGLEVGDLKMSAVMKKFGGNISLQGSFPIIKIEIVDSEVDHKDSRKSKGKGKQSKGKKAKDIRIDAGSEKAPFQCDALDVRITMKDVIDEIQKSHDEFGSVMGSAQDMFRRSQGPFKMESDMEAKPTTTMVNFSLNCNSMSQHVNMSLLRLVHQFVTMIQNINDTRTELKDLSGTDLFHRHRKQDSKGSSSETGTDIQSLGHADLSSVQPSESVITRHTTIPVEQRPSDLPIPSRSDSRLQTSALFGHKTERLGFGYRSPKKTSFRKGHLPLEVLTTKAAIELENLHSPPHSLNMSDSVNVEVGDMSSPALAEKTIVDEIRENTPRCWRKLYEIMWIYYTMPETKTVEKRLSGSRLSVINEEPERASQTHSKQGSTTRVGRDGDVAGTDLEAAIPELPEIEIPSIHTSPASTPAGEGVAEPIIEPESAPRTESSSRAARQQRLHRHRKLYTGTAFTHSGCITTLLTQIRLYVLHMI